MNGNKTHSYGSPPALGHFLWLCSNTKGQPRQPFGDLHLWPPKWPATLLCPSGTWSPMMWVIWSYPWIRNLQINNDSLTKKRSETRPFGDDSP